MLARRIILAELTVKITIQGLLQSATTLNIFRNYFTISASAGFILRIREATGKVEIVSLFIRLLAGALESRAIFQRPDNTVVILQKCLHSLILLALVGFVFQHGCGVRCKIS